MCEPIDLVFMGTPQFAVPSLEALTEAPFRIRLVVTPPDRRAGRGRREQDESEARGTFDAALNTVPEGPREGHRGEDFVMGHVMAGLRGRVAGRTVRTWVKEALA